MDEGKTHRNSTVTLAIPTLNIQAERLTVLRCESGIFCTLGAKPLKGFIGKAPQGRARELSENGRTKAKAYKLSFRNRNIYFKENSGALAKKGLVFLGLEITKVFRCDIAFCVSPRRITVQSDLVHSDNPQ